MNTIMTADAVRIARAGLTQLIEPADELGNHLIELWGAEQLLEVVKTRNATTEQWVQVSEKFLSSDGQSPVRIRYEKAIARWHNKLRYLNPQRALKAIEQRGGEFIVPSDSHWPEQLNDLVDSRPIGLWVIGSVENLDFHRCLAVVGTREITAYGAEATRRIIASTRGRGITIISGGAHGIDAQAHHCALQLGDVNEIPTVAVLAGGLDKLYPAANEELLSTVAHRGALISEMPPGLRPNRYRFLNRNRLIAALACATVVVEARFRSGAQNTAHHALGLERNLGVVPGPITTPNSAGCHRLLKETPAQLVDDSASLSALMGLANTERGTVKDSAESIDGLSLEQLMVYEALPKRKFTFPNKVQSITGFSIPTVISILQHLKSQELAEESRAGWRKAQCHVAKY